MTGKQPLTELDRARATAALDIWYANPGGSDYRVPSHPGWSTEELEGMHAALEASDTDAALAAFGLTAENAWMSTPEEAEQNRALMTAIREAVRSSDHGRAGHPGSVPG